VIHTLAIEHHSLGELTKLTGHSINNLNKLLIKEPLFGECACSKKIRPPTPPPTPTPPIRVHTHAHTHTTLDLVPKKILLYYYKKKNKRYPPHPRQRKWQV
jgi:hypothetical protein